MRRGQHRRPSAHPIRRGLTRTVLVAASVLLVLVAAGILGYVALDWWDGTGAPNTPGSACVTCPKMEGDIR